MSWDIVVARFTEAAAGPVDAEPSRPRIPLGGLRDVQDRIKAALPELDARVGDALWHYRGMGFGIEFDFGRDALVEDLHLHVVGFGDPIAVLVRFARPNRDRLAADGESFRSLAETVLGFGCYVGEVVARESGPCGSRRTTPSGRPPSRWPCACRAGPDSSIRSARRRSGWNAGQAQVY